MNDEYGRSQIKFYMDLFHNKGYETYLVGGAVRDILMDISPHDYDLTVNAPKETILSILKEENLVSHTAGYNFGMVSAKSDFGDIEITEFRREDKYDGRKPEIVEFTNSLEEDASRRDFTINAIYMDRKGKIIDPFNGNQDIEDKIIRTCGNPEKALEDDHLRILRAIRFAAKFDFSLADDLKKVLKEKAWKLYRISAERIADELDKMIFLDKPLAPFYKLEEYGILKIVLPELSRCKNVEQNHPNHKYDVFEHSLVTLSYIKQINPNLRWAALLHDVGKVVTKTTDEKGIDHFYEHAKAGAYIVEQIGQRLKWSKNKTAHIKNLVYFHLMPRQKFRPVRFFRKFIKPYQNTDLQFQLFRLRDLYALSQADTFAKKGDHNDPEIDEILENFEKIHDKLSNYTEMKPLLNGFELINLFGIQGKDLGVIIKKLMEWQLEAKDDGKELSKAEAVDFVSVTLTLEAIEEK